MIWLFFLPFAIWPIVSHISSTLQNKTSLFLISWKVELMTESLYLEWDIWSTHKIFLDVELLSIAASHFIIKQRRRHKYDWCGARLCTCLWYCFLNLLLPTVGLCLMVTIKVISMFIPICCAYLVKCYSQDSHWMNSIPRWLAKMGWSLWSIHQVNLNRSGFSFLTWGAGSCLLKYRRLDFRTAFQLSLDSSLILSEALNSNKSNMSHCTTKNCYKNLIASNLSSLPLAIMLDIYSKFAM